MRSYIQVHYFEPSINFKPLDELIPAIEKSMAEQKAYEKLPEDKIDDFKNNIVQCLDAYYRLVGVSDEVIEGKGKIAPRGILPRFTESLINYFQKLEHTVPANDEITTLKYSGVNTIKIRYKYVNSVIKKLVKLGLRDPSILDDPIAVFLNGGALHDLIGILFVCSYPYEKEWVARALYNFFYFHHRADDHLLYGFYTVEKQSGYRALHCDHTMFSPRFDDKFTTSDYENAGYSEIFDLFDPNDDTVEILDKFKSFFNIEIQLHTTFENVWATMEHANSYDIQAKGLGRSSRIMAKWKLLSENMKNLEEQFEQLQVETEQIYFETKHHELYIPVKDFISEMDPDLYPIYFNTSKKIEDLEELLVSHEISRQDYVQQLRDEISAIDKFSKKQQNKTLKVAFELQSAFIYYGLANQSQYFNTYDIRQFVKEAMNRYEVISNYLSGHRDIYRGNMLNILSIFRYLYLGQKYGMGLFNPPKEFFAEEDNPIVSYESMLSFFKTGISLLNGLSEQEVGYFSKDGSSFIKVIYQYDLMAREWELFNDEEPSDEDKWIEREIDIFRKKYINESINEIFTQQLESRGIKNIGFVVKFYTAMVWHGFIYPTDALKQIVRYSAYEKIKSSELFHYELSAYRSLDMHKNSSGSDARIEHLKNYHIKNMIGLLFRIKRSESTYKFYECRLYFEQLTQSRFKIDYFSDTVLQNG